MQEPLPQVFREAFTKPSRKAIRKASKSVQAASRSEVILINGLTPLRTVIKRYQALSTVAFANPTDVSRMVEMPCTFE